MQNYIEFLRKSNKKFIIYKNIPWVYYQGFLQPASFPHIEVNLSKKEAEELLNMSKTLFLRWSSDFDCRYNTEWWYVIKDDKSDLSLLSLNTRSKIRRGLKNYIVHKIDALYLANNGYEVYRSAFSRYKGGIKPTSKQSFKNSILSSINFPEVVEYFGVFYKDKLVGYAMNYIQDNAVNYSTIKYNPYYLKYYSSYALIFEMNNYYLNEKKVKYVYDGARSIYHQTNVQEYLINKFKFRKAYCKLNIVYSTKMKLLVSCLYPLRKLFSKASNLLENLNLLNKLNSILIQEEIRRACGGYKR